MLRLKSLLKRQFPRPNVGMGPEIKNILPLCLHKLKRQLNSSLIVSDPLVKMSLVPTWIIILIIEDGSEGMSSWSFLRFVETVAPGKRFVIALENRTDLIIESPRIRVDGGNKGGMKGDFGDLADGVGDRPAADCTGSASAWSTKSERGQPPPQTLTEAG